MVVVLSSPSLKIKLVRPSSLLPFPLSLTNSLFAISSHAVPEGVPPITTSQHVALDALHLTAETTALSIDLLPGDLEYFNNLTVFHARTASEDTPEETRHLLRIWLKNEEFRTEHGKKFQKRWDGLERNEKEHPEEKWPLQAWDRV